MTNQIFRKLIEVEIKLGFLSIPSKSLELMPSENTKISVVINGKKERVAYNTDYRRIFGLTSWMRENNAEVGDLVIITKKDDEYLFLIKKQNISENEIKQEEAEEIIDLSGLSTQAKGDIVEDRIKELVLLYGQGLLNVYKPVVDTEGIDLIVVRNGQFHPIFIQSKGRYSLQNDKNIILRVRVKTFSPHSNYYVVGAFFDPKTLEIEDNLLLIPSKEIVKNASKVKSIHGEWYNIVSSLDKNSNGMWSKYLIKKTELANKLLEKFEEIEEYVK